MAKKAKEVIAKAEKVIAENTKKKRGPHKPKVKVARSAPWHIALQPLILQHTILPLLRALLQQTNPQNVADLFNNFCSRTNAKVSRTVFNSWLKDLGITFRQTTTFSLPDPRTIYTTAPDGSQQLGGASPQLVNTDKDHKEWMDAQVRDGGGVSEEAPDESGFTMTNDVEGPGAVPAQFSMAQAAHNANSPTTLEGIPTDQLALTPRLAALL